MIRRLFRLSVWLALAAILFATLSPIELRPEDLLPVNYDRAIAFAAVSALFVLAYPRNWFWVGLAIVVGAGAIELLQELSPTRHADATDALVKAAGASLGVLAGWSINAVLERGTLGRIRR